VCGNWKLINIIFINSYVTFFFMATINQLVEELKNLSKRYSELADSHGELFTKKDAERFQRRLIEAGKLVVDFYEKSFVPNYSKIQDPVIEVVGGNLSGLSQMASGFLENKNYFGLDALLTPRGSREGDPNCLDMLIQKLKKSKNKKFKR